MPAKPSALVDTRVIYCGDNLEQLPKLPDAVFKRNGTISKQRPAGKPRPSAIKRGDSSDSVDPETGESRRENVARDLSQYICQRR